MIPLLTAFLLVAQEQPPERCSIAGTVVDSVTARPLNKVQVRLQRTPRDTADSGTITDAEGKFAIAGIEPGTYRLRASRNGYQDTYLGARRADTTGTTISLTAGQKLTGLKVKLQPFALISGTVRDADGEPLVGVTVRALRWLRVGIQRHLVPGGSGSTDDLGQYRLAQMRPGTYLLRVDPRSDPDVEDRTPGQTKRREFDTTTYYPGGADWSAAAPIELAAGARLTGVDGRPRQVDLRDAHSDALFIGEEVNTQVKPDGTFEFRSVSPGSYRIRGWVGVFLGNATVNVGNSDVEGVSIAVGTGTEVAGRVRVDGEWKGPLKDCVADFLSAGNSFQARPSEDGTFRVSLYADRYTVQFYCSGVYLKSARAGGTDLLAEGLTVGESGKLQIELTVSPEVGQVSGTAVDADDKPAAGATVLLAPEEKLREQEGRFQSETTDQYGRFTFKDIPAGEYKVFAWDDVEQGAWFDAEFLKKSENAGEPVTVRAKQQESVKVKIGGD